MEFEANPIGVATILAVLLALGVSPCAKAQQPEARDPGVRNDGSRQGVPYAGLPEPLQKLFESARKRSERLKQSTMGLDRE